MPRESVTYVVPTPVASSVSVTLAPGITPPVESVITPVSCAVYVDCATAGVIQLASKKRDPRKNARKGRPRLRGKDCIPHPLMPGVRSEDNLPYFRLLSFTFF